MRFSDVLHCGVVSVVHVESVVELCPILPRWALNALVHCLHVLNDAVSLVPSDFVPVQTLAVTTNLFSSMLIGFCMLSSVRSALLSAITAASVLSYFWSGILSIAFTASDVDSHAAHVPPSLAVLARLLHVVSAPASPPRLPLGNDVEVTKTLAFA